jgi:hypothetical protein
MTSDSDDLEQQLRENLKLRRELAAEVAKAKGSASQRVSRGFHRFGLLLAVLMLFVGSAFLWSTWGSCRLPHRRWQGECRSIAVNNATGEMLVHNGEEWVRYNWWTEFWSNILPNTAEALAITVVFALAVYALVRAIGWVIGSFMAS